MNTTNNNNGIYSEIKDIESDIKLDHEEHISAIYDMYAPIGADFEHWTSKYCLSLKDYLLEVVDDFTYYDLEFLYTMLALKKSYYWKLEGMP